MFLGLGNDIIENERIAMAIQRHGQRFLDRIFTAQEQDYCSKHRSVERYAGRFAAKEAISKALGTGISEGINWLDIEILNDENGKPIVRLSHALQQKLTQTTIHLSISHCRNYTTAVAIWEDHPH
jgi:holo-[acyl-carrier protein] synthase